MENDMMTVLLVQPGKHPVEITIPHTLKELQKQVGGTIEIVYPWPDRSVGLVCHDEGKLLGLPLNRALPEIGDAIAGDFLLCGLCDRLNIAKTIYNFTNSMPFKKARINVKQLL